MSNYLIYPFKTMRITQRYDGTTSHLKHMLGVPKEYALDEGGVDAGRDWLFCPCDEMKIVRLYGAHNRGVNSIWLTSTAACDLANGRREVVTMIITHPNDDDMDRLRKGQILKRGQAICREGTDGASGNHIHFAVGLGTITGNGWVCNSKNKWVLTTTRGPIKPEHACYLDKSFTTVKDAKQLEFKSLPKASTPTPAQKPAATPTTTKKYTPGNYMVTAELLHVRTGPGTNYTVKTFNQLTANARTQIKKQLKGSAANGFVHGMVCTVSTVQGKWGQCPSGWVCLEYCKKV